MTCLCEVEIGPYLNIAIAEGDTAAKVVGAREMPVERSGVELSEDVDFVDPAVDAVAHWHINQSV